MTGTTSSSAEPQSPAIQVVSSAASLSAPGSPPSPTTRMTTHGPADMLRQVSGSSSSSYPQQHQQQQQQRKTSVGLRRSSTNSKPLPLDHSLAASPASRPTSPRSLRGHTGDAHHSSIPPSPSRSSMSGDASGLFERDVEFPTEHILNRQEAQDVAIPPVLQEAAHVLTADDVQPEEVQQMIRSATSSSGLSSVGTRSPGWQSPVQPSSSSADVLANASSSSPTSASAAAAASSSSAPGMPASVSSPLRSSLMAAVGSSHQPSTSNAPISARRAGASPSRMSQHGLAEGVPRPSSPMSSTLSTSPPDSALFTPSTSPSPPPTTLPFEAGGSPDQSKSHLSSSLKSQTIAARMGVPPASGIHEEDGAASSAPPHTHAHAHPTSHSPPSATALGFQEPPPVRKPPLRPEFMKGSSQDILQLPGSFPVGSAAPAASAPPSPALDNMEASTLSSGLSDSGLGNSTVASGSTNRNRRLSFMSYADIINTERAEADLTSSASGGSLSQSMSMHQLWADLPAKEAHSPALSSDEANEPTLTHTAAAA